MDKRDCREDRFGNLFEKDYVTILSDPFLERKLKDFDERLKLVYNKEKDRWVILEWALDNSGWNVIYIFEDDFGNKMPPGEYVLMHLKDMRDNNDALRADVDQYFLNLENKVEDLTFKEEAKIGDLHKHLIREHINPIRKAFRSINNKPTADITAGYRKI